MKHVQSSAAKPTRVKPEAISTWYTQPWTLGAVLLVLACVAYAAVLRAPFLFDDFGLPYAKPLASSAPFFEWIRGVRPVLLISYWLNYEPPPTSTLPFHLTNIALHAGNALLVFLVAKQLFRRVLSDERKILGSSLFCSGLFLLHPLQ